MLMQNYINIFQNESGKVTIAYAAIEKEDSIGIEGVNYIAVDVADLVTIGQALLDLAENIEG